MTCASWRGWLGHRAEGARHRRPGPRRRPAADEPVRHAELRRDHPSRTTPASGWSAATTRSWPPTGPAPARSCSPPPRTTWPRSRASADAGRLKDPDKIGITGRQGHRQAEGGQALHHSTSAPAASPGAATRRRSPPRPPSTGSTSSAPACTGGILDAAGAVTAYKNLKYVERDFRITKADDLDLRPIYHYLADRVRGHVLICMLACYLTWHLRAGPRRAHLHRPAHPRSPATPSPPPSAQPRPRPKTPAKHTPGGLPAYRYRDLLEPPVHPRPADHHLRRAAASSKLTTPTPVQRRRLRTARRPQSRSPSSSQ